MVDTLGYRIGTLGCRADTLGYRGMSHWIEGLTPYIVIMTPWVVGLTLEVVELTPWFCRNDTRRRKAYTPAWNPESLGCSRLTHWSRDDILLPKDNIMVSKDDTLVSQNDTLNTRNDTLVPKNVPEMILCLNNRVPRQFDPSVDGQLLWLSFSISLVNHNANLPFISLFPRDDTLGSRFETMSLRADTLRPTIESWTCTLYPRAETLDHMVDTHFT